MDLAWTSFIGFFLGFGFQQKRDANAKVVEMMRPPMGCRRVFSVGQSFQGNVDILDPFLIFLN